MYEDLIPESLLRSENKIQIFNSFTELFILQSDTEFIVINLECHIKWYNQILNLNIMADFPKWASIHSMFQEACEIICPEMKDVTIMMRQHVDGHYMLDYNIRNLNSINGREQTRYPWMPFKWRKNSFITVLPVYFFKSIKEIKPRKFIILNND